MSARHLLILLGLLLLAGPAPAAPAGPAPGSVVVLPLTYRYQVVQDYSYSYAQVDSYLKGKANETAKTSVRSGERSNPDLYQDGEEQAVKTSVSRKGDYNLKSGATARGESWNDRTIVEKRLDSDQLAGYLESALSEAGYRIVDRASIAKMYPGSAKKSDPAAAEDVYRKIAAKRSSDYVLNGQIESIRLDSPRNTGHSARRYSVQAVVRVNVRLLNVKDGSAGFARTLTGRAAKTFDAADPIPAAEVTDAAMDDLAHELVSALTGRPPKSLDDESDYADSPGKRLIGN